MKNADRPLVSLITPCHNGATHIKPYLDGLLSQTYKNVQYIFVNDGSGDETEKIILSYKDAIRANGWDFVYIHQKQAGQAAAVNAALKEVRGKYFSQVDSDDVLYPHYLEKYCAFLENNPDCKFCYARVAVARENFLDKPYRVRYRQISKDGQDDFFNDLLNEVNVPPLAFYMIETAAFFEVVKLPLYENKGGQNWQILLPMAYHYKCGYIDEVLATCVQRKASHSHTVGGYDDRQDDLKKILFHTISRLNIPDGEKAFYYDQITNKYLLKALSRDSEIKLFGFIPILKIRRKWNKISLRLFNVLPIAAITPPNPPYTHITITHKQLMTSKRYYDRRPYSLPLYRQVRVYFDACQNFGDLLNIEIAKYFGINIDLGKKSNSDAMFIGSLLSRFVEGKKYWFAPAIKVWGTGFGRPPASPQEKLKRPLEIYAVRGQISLERLRGITGSKLENVTLGDPALLASRLIDVSKIEKKYRLGIVPHYVDKNNPLLEKIKVKDACILNIQQEPLDFLNRLAECENVISSALHGLIAADSLGIPNIRMMVSDKIKGGDYKFDDYYSAYGITNHARIDLRVMDDFNELDSIKEKYAITAGMVENICHDLIAVFPYKNKVPNGPTADFDSEAVSIERKQK